MKSAEQYLTDTLGPDPTVAYKPVAYRTLVTGIINQVLRDAQAEATHTARYHALLATAIRNAKAPPAP